MKILEYHGSVYVRKRMTTYSELASVKIPFGYLVFSWTPKGQLKSVRWQFQQPENSKSQDIPAWLSILCENYLSFFERGDPISPLPWFRIDQSGWTRFQQQVYQVASEIPLGETRNYFWIASRIGNPNASRAVGQALRKNPILILIPCHRVVPFASSLRCVGGFMGKNDPNEPEIQLKTMLLKLEEEFVNPVFSFVSQASPRQGEIVGSSIHSA